MSKKDKNALRENIETQKKNNTPLSDGDVFVEKKKKKSKAKKVYPKTTFKHKMKVIGCLALLGIFTGCGLGVWYFNTALRSNVDYSTDPTTVMGNVDTVFSAMGIKKQDGWVDTAKANGKTPLDFSVADNILLAEYNHTLAGTYSVVGKGKVLTMGTTQTVYSEKLYDGSRYSFVSISAGLLTVASCDVIVPNGSIDVYAGSNPHATGATWTFDKNYSAAQYSAMNGVMPDAPHPYIISDKTIDQASEITLNTETGNYEFTVTLKTVESALLYYKQVQRSGGLEADPEFHSIEIKFSINQDWQFVETDIVESYKAVKFGLPVTCDGTLTTVYNYDGEVVLPV